MKLHVLCSVFLTAVLLAGCAAGEDASAPPDQSPEPSTAVIEPIADIPSGPVFVDDSDSPYPMAVERWSADMDGDGVDELVELWAERCYLGNSTDGWYESVDYGLHPYFLRVTTGETAVSLPLGWELDDEQPLRPCYFPLGGTLGGAFWTQDAAEQPVLVLGFDNMSQGGAGGIDLYALAFQDGEPVLLPVPMYGIQAVLDEETMIAQLTVPETGYTGTLDLMEWLEKQEQRNRESGHDFEFCPLYSEDGVLEWPAAPGNIDGIHHAEPAGQGITVRQYLYGSAHVDGMGDLVTTLSWENGEAVVLDQYFDWD